MNKRIIGILLLACMILGMLPVVAMADTPKTASIALMSDITLNATEGGTPVYYKNVSYQAYTKEGAENGTCWTQTKGDENDWNVKFEYPTGGIPTVTWKDAKLDMVGDDGKAAYKKNVNAETGEITYTTSRNGSISAIFPKSVNDIKLVLQGDNHVDTTYGIIRHTISSTQYFKNIYIVGENGGKLTGRGRTFNLGAKAGHNLTIENAVLDMGTATGSGSEAIPIRVLGGNLTIKNSTVTCSNEKQVAISVVGNMEIIDSTLNATNKLTSTSAATGAVSVTGNVTVTNSTLNLEGKNCPGINATESIMINSGKVNVTAAEYGMHIGTEGSIIIMGGSVEITAKRAFNKAPTLGADVSGMAGLAVDDEDNAPYEDEMYAKPYVKLEKGFTPPTTQPTTKPTTQPTTQPTTKPTTQPTTKPATQPTTKPATQPTESSTAPTQGDEAPTGGNDAVIAIAIVAVALVVAVAIVVIAKKKRAAA